MLHSLLIRLEEALIHRIEVETARTVTLMLAAMLEEDREERLELLRLASRSPMWLRALVWAESMLPPQVS